MKANNGTCLNLVSIAQVTYSADLLTPAQDASPSQILSKQCWYAFAAEYTEAN